MNYQLITVIFGLVVCGRSHNPWMYPASEPSA